MWPYPCEMKWCYYVPRSIKPKFNKNKRPQLKFISFRSWFIHYNFSYTLGLVLFPNFSYMLLGNHQSLIHIMLNWTGARWISEERQWRHQLDSNDSLSSFTKHLYVLLVVLHTTCTALSNTQGMRGSMNPCQITQYDVYSIPLTCQPNDNLSQKDM